MSAEANSTLKLGHRRRAVYAALIKVLGDADARPRKVFAVFERNFASPVHFLVMRFVAEAQAAAGLSEDEKVALMRAVYLSLATPYESLPHFPQDWAEGALVASPTDAAANAPMAAAPADRAAPASAAVVEPPSAQAIVFGAVARALLGAVRAAVRSNRGMIGQMISDAMSHTQLRQGLPARVSTWVDGGGVDDRLANSLHGTDLRAIVHVLYLAACDALGPVAADQLLSQSIMRAQSLPASVEFSPDNLL